MRGFLAGLAVAALLIAAAAAYLWYLEPERLPAEWRRENPRSRDYAPAVYRWKDDQGVVQLTDAPPRDRPYVALRLRRDQNVDPPNFPTTSGH